ncbi:F-box only protein 46-like [Eucyclogobius newberryi]|uniref:F-box only protein 46-like n=1 Tax=Eucyclogobius newberryi TaxID=166745 RepID=UPI003B5C81A3
MAACSQKTAFWSWTGDVENTPTEQDVSLAPQIWALSPTPSPTPLSAGTQVEDDQALLDTWYDIKTGNTKEKIAFCETPQISEARRARPSAMKVKGNWATDCSKAKRRCRGSSYDPPTHSLLPLTPSAEWGLLSVAEMVALIEQRTALALQDIVGLHSSLHNQSQASNHQLLCETISHPTPLVFVPNRPSKDLPDSSSQIQTDQELVEQQKSCRVAEAIAHFESQHLENRLHLGHGINSQIDKDDGARGASSGIVTPPPRIAFRVSNIDLCSQLEPAGRLCCMFMTCGGGTSQSNTRSKESLLLAATSAAPKQDSNSSNTDTNSTNGSDLKQEHSGAEMKSREGLTGFHVEVVMTGAVDQCIFFGKDSTENVQKVCFTSAPEQSHDPPPGELFFLQRGPGVEIKSANTSSNASGKAGDCANNNSGGDSPINSDNARPELEECSDSSLCRLYRHVSHDFLELRFQIQRLLEPRQYMLLLPDHVTVNILAYLPTHSLATLKCTCHYFKALIETYGVRAVDSGRNQDPRYSNDPCKQCKRQYVCGDVTLCRWHPKPYHHALPYGSSYWMCCRRTDKATPGCRVGLHDNYWVQHSSKSQVMRARRDERRRETR